jgi:hypothetical protein
MYGDRDVTASAKGTDPRSNLPASDRIGSMLGAVENEYENLPRAEAEQVLITNRALKNRPDSSEKTAGPHGYEPTKG